MLIKSDKNKSLSNILEYIIDRVLKSSRIEIDGVNVRLNGNGEAKLLIRNLLEKEAVNKVTHAMSLGYTPSGRLVPNPNSWLSSISSNALVTNDYDFDIERVNNDMIKKLSLMMDNELDYIRDNKLKLMNVYKNRVKYFVNTGTNNKQSKTINIYQHEVYSAYELLVEKGYIKGYTVKDFDLDNFTKVFESESHTALDIINDVNFDLELKAVLISDMEEDVRADELTEDIEYIINSGTVTVKNVNAGVLVLVKLITMLENKIGDLELLRYFINELSSNIETINNYISINKRSDTLIIYIDNDAVDTDVYLIKSNVDKYKELGGSNKAIKGYVNNNDYHNKKTGFNENIKINTLINGKIKLELARDTYLNTLNISTAIEKSNRLKTYYIYGYDYISNNYKNINIKDIEELLNEKNLAELGEVDDIIKEIFIKILEHNSNLAVFLNAVDEYTKITNDKSILGNVRYGAIKLLVLYFMREIRIR